MTNTAPVRLHINRHCRTLAIGQTIAGRHSGIAYAPALFALCLMGSGAGAQSAQSRDIWAQPTTYICTVDRPDRGKTLLAVQTSGTDAQVHFRMVGLNGWPEKQVSATSLAPLVVPIPPFEGGISHLANFEASIDGRPYRLHFTVSIVPLLKAHKPIEQDGVLLTNRSATLSFSAARQGTATQINPVSSGYCEAQDDDGAFKVVD